MTKVGVLLADDHRLVRAGLASLISEIPGYEVVAEANDGIEALELAPVLRPALIIMDVHMPRLSGLDCLPQVSGVLPEARVLMLSMHSNEEHVMRALELGALGYLLKDAAPTELELAVKTVVSGNIWLSSTISPQVLGRYALRNRDHAPDEALTPRQQLVLKRLAEGSSVKQIAFELELSVKTIETYRTQIMQRLGLYDLPALVRYAIRNGIVAL